jgi:hypothetical protein
LPEHQIVWSDLIESGLFPEMEPPPGSPPVPNADGPRELLEPFTTTLAITGVDHLLKALRLFRSTLGCWVYRGQPFINNGLAPSIERITVPPHSSRREIELYIRSEFKRRAPHYLARLPNYEDELAWLALMRHHGAPSRLLDWTRSPYVAAFFAVSKAKPDKPCEIWAIDQKALDLEAARRVHLDYRAWKDTINSKFRFRTAFLEAEPQWTVIAPIEPFEASERMIIQQGLFLASATIAASFASVLARMAHEADLRLPLFRFEIKPEHRTDVLAELESMNITEATLYPGIDGFARSLGASAEIPGKILADWHRLVRGYDRPEPAGP